jgi:hypothetical protein
MAKPSQLYDLIEERLRDETLAEYVARNYAAMGWRAMARDLHRRTGISISYNTLRAWFADRITVEVKVAS